MSDKLNPPPPKSWTDSINNQQQVTKKLRQQKLTEFWQKVPKPIKRLRQQELTEFWQQAPREQKPQSSPNSHNSDRNQPQPTRSLRQTKLTELWAKPTDEKAVTAPTVHSPHCQANGCSTNKAPPAQTDKQNRKTAAALLSKEDPDRSKYICRFGPVLFFHCGEHNFYAIDSSYYRNTRVAAAELYYVPGETPGTEQFWLNHIDVGIDYRRRKIGTNMIRAITRFLRKSENTLWIPANIQSNDEGLYLTQEGKKLIDHCIERNYINRKQCADYSRAWTTSPMVF